MKPEEFVGDSREIGKIFSNPKSCFTIHVPSYATILYTMEYLWSVPKRFKKPIFFALAERDMLVDNKYAIEWVSKCGSDVSRVKFYKCGHQIHMESDRENFMKDQLKFVEEQLKNKPRNFNGVKNFKTGLVYKNNFLSNLIKFALFVLLVAFVMFKFI